MNTEAQQRLQTNVRRLVLHFLQELDVAAACLDEIRASVEARAVVGAPSLALSLFACWARAETAIRALAQLPGGGGASENFARDALGAARRAGRPWVAELLVRLAQAATDVDEGALVTPLAPRQR
jgi:hypothetical protein